MAETLDGATQITIDLGRDYAFQVNSGAIETVNLAECLAIDFAVLMAQVVPELSTVAKSHIPPADGITDRSLLNLHLC
jgi:hypothetical protein